MPNGPRVRAERSRGQSLAEFALVAPIMLILMLGIVDLARIYTTMLTIESAAREAADYGAFNSSNWIGDPADPASNYAKTVLGMTERARVAAGNLTDFAAGPDPSPNPAIAVTLTDASGNPATGCDDPHRVPGPCRVRVDLTYNFRMIAPLGFDFFGVRLGFPQSLPFVRTSVFAISDFDIDT